MTTIRDLSTYGAEPRYQPVRLSGHVYPRRLVASGAIRRAPREDPVAADPHRGRRPPPVAPHREERCPATLTPVRSEVFCF